MSLDLAVLAMDASADTGQARAMAGRCWRSAAHAEGEVDERITAFYAELCTRFPPDSPDSPWMAALDVGIDHVIMNLSWSAKSTPVIESIRDLAAEHRLVIFDPQSEDAYLPGQLHGGFTQAAFTTSEHRIGRSRRLPVSAK